MMTCSGAGEVSGDEKVKTEDSYDVDISDLNTLDSVSDIQEHRRQLLSDGCRKFSHIVNGSTRASYEMYYDDKMDYVYCLVSKVACTNWKRTLMMLSGKISNLQRPEQLPFAMVHYRSSSGWYYEKYIKRLEKEYGDLRFKDDRYFTFMFVREPLERLVLAYRDKLLENLGYDDVDIDIVRQYRPHEYNASAKRYNVTFAEFVRYVLDQHSAGKVLDRHWIPQNELCRVCQLRWDFIGHYDTLLEDSDYVVSKLKSRIMDVEQRGRVANITFPFDSGHRKSSEFLQQMYATVPATHVRALYKLYAVDYALFGFKHPNVTGFS